MWQWTKASCQQLVRNWDFLLSALQVSHFLSGYPQPGDSLHMTAASANLFTVTWGETLSQKHPASFLWVSDAQKLYEDKCLLLSYAAKFWAACLHSNRYLIVRFEVVTDSTGEESAPNLGVPRKSTKHVETIKQMVTPESCNFGYYTLKWRNDCRKTEYMTLEGLMFQDRLKRIMRQGP